MFTSTRGREWFMEWAITQTGGGLAGSHLHWRMAEISGSVLCFCKKQGYFGQAARHTFFHSRDGQSESGLSLLKAWKQWQTAHDANWRAEKETSFGSVIKQVTPCRAKEQSRSGLPG